MRNKTKGGRGAGPPRADHGPQDQKQHYKPMTSEHSGLKGQSAQKGLQPDVKWLQDLESGQNRTPEASAELRG